MDGIFDVGGRQLQWVFQQVVKRNFKNTWQK